MPDVKPLQGIPKHSTLQSPTEILPRLPARLIVAGPSGAGKGNLICSLLLDSVFFRGCFSKIYYFSPSSTVDPALIPLKKYCEEVLGQGEDDPCVYDTWDAEVIEEILDRQTKVVAYQRKNKHKKEHGICIICDDWADQPSVVRHGILERLFIRMRHANVSTIVSTQRYRLLAPSVRVNATGLFVFRLRNKADLDAIIEENSAQVSSNVLRNIYHVSTNVPYGFLYINLASPDIAHMFYSSFAARLVVT